MRKKNAIIGFLIIIALVIIIISYLINNKDSVKFMSKDVNSDYRVLLEVDLGETNNFLQKQYFIIPKNKMVTVKYKNENYSVQEALDKKIITREDLENQTNHILVIGVYGLLMNNQTKIIEDSKYIYYYNGTYDYNIMYKRTNNTFTTAYNKKIIDLDILFKILPFIVKDRITGEIVNYQEINWFFTRNYTIISSFLCWFQSYKTIM